MYQNDYELEKLMDYRTGIFRQEAQAFRLARQALDGRSRRSLLDGVISALGSLLIRAGSSLSRKASRCLPLEERFEPAR